jgi:hypothetical protein
MGGMMKVRFELKELQVPVQSAVTEAERFRKLVEQAAEGKRPTYGQQMSVRTKIGATLKTTVRGQQVRFRLDIPISYRVRCETDYGLGEIAMNGDAPEYVRIDARGDILQKAAPFWSAFPSPVHYLQAVAKDYAQDFIDRNGEKLARSYDGEEWFLEPLFTNSVRKAIEDEVGRYVTLVGDGWHEMYRYSDTPELFVEWDSAASEARLACRTGVKAIDVFDWQSNLLRFPIFEANAAAEVLKLINGTMDVETLPSPFQILDVVDAFGEFHNKIVDWQYESFIADAVQIADTVAGNVYFSGTLQKAAWDFSRSERMPLAEERREAERFLELLENESKTFQVVLHKKGWELPVSPLEILKARLRIADEATKLEIAQDEHWGWKGFM